MEYAAGAAVVVGGAVVVVVGGGAVVVVDVVFAGAAVVLVDVVSGNVVVVVDVVDIDPTAVEVVDGGNEVSAAVSGRVDVVVDVGSPIATGASTTRSRMPATAADAINTESTVAPSQAAPIPQYLLICSSMTDNPGRWVKTRLSHDQRNLRYPTSRLPRV